MESVTVRYLVAMLYVFVNALNTWRAIVSFKKELYGFFGWHVSMFILNVIMMVRIIFLDNL